MGETFQFDTVSVVGTAYGPVLQTAPPSSGGYNVRFRWNAGSWSPSFGNTGLGVGFTGSFADADTSTPAADDTHWVERVSETLFTYYRGADLGSRVKVSDVTFNSPGPGNVYVGFQVWSATVQADNFAIVSPDGPALPAGTTTETFQEGVDGYSCTADTYIGSASPSSAAANYGSATKLLVHLTGSGDALVRFDDIFGTGAGQVPLGSTISSATLSLQTGNATWDGTDPDSWEVVHQLL